MPFCLQSAKTSYCITQALINAVTGGTENGLIFCGANAWREDRITTVREVLKEYVGDEMFTENCVILDFKEILSNDDLK